MTKLRSVLNVLLLLFISLEVMASTSPRTDLYKQIKKETGVSLKEAFQAVSGKNTTALANLGWYAKKVGIKEIEQTFADEISGLEQRCAKKRAFDCDSSIQDLKSQVSFIREMHGKCESRRDGRLPRSLLLGLGRCGRGGISAA